MIVNFFQSLEQLRVEYLLISGQATVLYGAATFSEDIDLWIRPTRENRDRLVAALCDCGAAYYKLTPPLTVEHLQAGHGFHFLLPSDDPGGIYLDVLGKPPRAGSFAEALATSHQMDTEWGLLRAIGIKPLVELKKTQRLEDYPIISKLALAWLARPECGRGQTDWLWAVQNIFTTPELGVFFSEHPSAIETAAEFNPDVAEFGRQMQADGEPSEMVERRVRELYQHRITEFQQADRILA